MDPLLVIAIITTIGTVIVGLIAHKTAKHKITEEARLAELNRMTHFVALQVNTQQAEIDRLREDLLERDQLDRIHYKELQDLRATVNLMQRRIYQLEQDGLALYQQLVDNNIKPIVTFGHTN